MTRRISDLDLQIMDDPRHPASATLRSLVTLQEKYDELLAAVAPNRETGKRCALCKSPWHRSDNRACLVARLLAQEDGAA